MDTETGTGRERAQQHRAGRQPHTDVLIVGTLGSGGGIHRYMREQEQQLGAAFAVSVYDMFTPESGDGVVWFLRGLLGALVAAAVFPFRTRPDVVHVHTSHRFSFYRASYYVLFAAYVWRRPVIVHVHGSSFDEFVETDSRPVRWLQVMVFRAADRVIVLSSYWRDTLTPLVDEERLSIVPNAVDTSGYTPSFTADPPHVVFVSSLSERKGVSELVDALDALGDRDVEFSATIAGKGPEAPLVRGLAERHDNVAYRGYVSEAAKRELLCEGSIFVLPTHAEGLPIALLEGMAGGNAVVSTPVGSIPEVISEENGVLIEPGDDAALTAALATLLSSPSDIERIGRRNHRLVVEEYSWGGAVDRLERIYEEQLPVERRPRNSD
jgi:glycosyltransferase involved in cell wall biosynthesis